jgi:hypothetical protein
LNGWVDMGAALFAGLQVNLRPRLVFV